MKKTGSNSTSQVYYSVVVPAYNEEKAIGKCLKHLSRQITNKSYEVILVNNNSTDLTVDIAKKYQNQLNLKIIHQSLKGRGAARYLGFQTAKGKIILSTDADAFAPPNWISTLSSPIESETCIASTSACTFHDCSSRLLPFLNWIQPIAMHLYRFILGSYWLNGFSFAIKSNIYRQIGGFDPHLNALEDVYISDQVKKVGKIVLVSQTKVSVSGRRFNHNPILGLLSYFIAYLQYIVSSKKQSHLSDIR